MGNFFYFMELIEYDDRKFLIKYRREDIGFDETELEIIKTRTHSDTIFKQDNILIFCRELEDVEEICNGS